MNLSGQLAFALMLAIPVAAVSWTVTQEELFKEFRERLNAYQKRDSESFWRRKLAYIPTCPYCFSHYIAGVFVLLCQFPMLVPGWRGYLVSLLTVVLIANIYVSAYHLLRAGLRALRARADEAEANARYSRKLAAACDSSEPLMWNRGPLRDGHALRIGQRSAFPPPRRGPNGAPPEETPKAPFESQFEEK